MNSQFKVTHTIRVYESEWAMKLDALIQRVQDLYRNKNDFLVVLLKLGYESYIAAEKTANGSADKPASVSMLNVMGRDEGTIKELGAQIDELSTYMTTQFRHMNVNQSLYRRILSSVYNMMLAQIGGKMPPPEQVEQGFFDDLPARFEKIIVNLEKQYGLKT